MFVPEERAAASKWRGTDKSWQNRRWTLLDKAETGLVMIGGIQHEVPILLRYRNATASPLAPAPFSLWKTCFHHCFAFRSHAHSMHDGNFVSRETKLAAFPTGNWLGAPLKKTGKGSRCIGSEVRPNTSFLGLVGPCCKLLGSIHFQVCLGCTILQHGSEYWTIMLTVLVATTVSPNNGANCLGAVLLLEKKKRGSCT